MLETLDNGKPNKAATHYTRQIIIAKLHAENYARSNGIGAKLLAETYAKEAAECSGTNATTTTARTVTAGSMEWSRMR